MRKVCVVVGSRANYSSIKSAMCAIARHPDMLKLTYEEHGWGTRPMITLLPR